ncbi:MAG: RDD family protein [Pseudonocardia sp.]|nr:RDD family protein [Pseudonocardia sp.]
MVSAMNDLVTGDAVVLELSLAKLPSRALAFAIDLAVMCAGFLVLLIGTVASLTSVDEALAAAVVLVLWLLVFVGYPVIVETLSRGRSLGKMALGLRVVREDGGPIRFRHALTRGLAGFVVDFGVFSFFTGAVGLIASLASERGRRVGDMLAGTVVVRERVPTSSVGVVPMPAPLAGWAAFLELSRLPDSLAMSVRQFLQRAHQFDPQVRDRLGESLAGRVASLVSPPAPPGTPAWAYLAAVLAERRRREADRLTAGAAPATRPAVVVPAQRTASPRYLPPAGQPAGVAALRDEPPAPPGDGFVMPR